MVKSDCDHAVAAQTAVSGAHLLYIFWNMNEMKGAHWLTDCWPNSHWVIEWLVMLTDKRLDEWLIHRQSRSRRINWGLLSVVTDLLGIWDLARHSGMREFFVIFWDYLEVISRIIMDYFRTLSEIFSLNFVLYSTNLGIIVNIFRQEFVLYSWHFWSQFPPRQTFSV